MTLTNRRFPPPWTIEDIGAAFVVKDGGGQKLVYVYCESEPGRRSAAELVTKDEVRRSCYEESERACQPGALQLAPTFGTPNMQTVSPPPHRPLRLTLVAATGVIGFALLNAVVLYLATVGILYLRDNLCDNRGVVYLVP